MIRNMYILWDMVFVICMKIICRCFVGHGSYIYIYIYTLWETWNLKVHERYVWVFCGVCVWKIYGSVRWIIWRLNVARAAAGVVFCVMTLIMLLSKTGRFCMGNKEWDGDVFWVAKMMKFQNNGVGERWAMDYGML